MENSTFCCFFAVVVSLLCTTLHSAPVASYENVDREALVAFKSRITSDPFEILAKNWSFHTSICHWKGVSCGGSNHPRVTALNFSSFGFGGTISPNLGNLTFLVSLDIQSNNFAGFLPHELSQLRQLQLLNIGYNNFTGGIPPWFGNFGELHFVYLNNNNLFGSIPPSLCNNTILQEINLSNNPLGGNIPLEVGNLTSLKLLNLEYNQITGSIPHSIFNLSSIEIISLTSNVLLGTLLEDMCNSISKLRGLYASFNQLSGEIPFNIYECNELLELSLSYNHFNGSIPKSIGWLPKIQFLYVGGNDFLQGEIPIDLRNLSHIQKLSFGGAMSFNLPNLSKLSLGYNQLTGSIPKHLGNLTALEHLRLSRNDFTGIYFTMEKE